MKSIYEVIVNGPRENVAEFYANPANNTLWMHDLQKCEPISGEPGMPGSRYRMIPKKGSMVFMATVVTRNLPDQLRLRLEASNVLVSVTGEFVALSPHKTKLISEEVFTFKGPLGKLNGFVAQGAIRKAHRKHMRDFKQVFESIR